MVAMMIRATLPCCFLVGFLASVTVAQCRAQDAQASPAPVFVEQFPAASNDYALGADSKPQPGVPAGKTFKFEMTNSKVFPGTDRTITVYVPAEYKADRPACTFVFLDSIGFNAPVVLDNLIARHAIPVMIGIGVSPGVVNSAEPPANPRFDRSFEFDSRSDRLARFLIDEVIPAVESRPTPDGLPIKLSNNPNDRAIAGGSTGGIAAFTVAWERPDAFRRVFTAIGTFVGMRGGEQYYVLVRKTEPKPLRIFMQDGVHDEWPGGPEMGDWWMSNETMNRALEFAGYDVKHEWGAGTHNGNQSAALFPEVAQWLWRDWPAPITAQAPGNPVLQQILEPGETWQLVGTQCGTSATLAADAEGHVYVRGEGAQIAELKANARAYCGGSLGGGSGFAIGPDGRIYSPRTAGGIEVGAKGARTARGTIRAGNLRIQSLTVRSNGDIYATTVTRNGESELWRIPAKGAPKQLDSALKGNAEVAVTPDGLWLMVTQSRSRFGMSYRILADGSVNAREPFYDFAVPAWAEDSGAGEIAMDGDGRAYVATRMGVQVFDRNGRVAAILPLPGGGAAEGICFGGKDFDTLYVSVAGTVYARHMKEAGAPPWAVPAKLPPWGAG